MTINIFLVPTVLLSPGLPSDQEDIETQAAAVAQSNIWGEEIAEDALEEGEEDHEATKMDVSTRAGSSYVNSHGQHVD